MLQAHYEPPDPALWTGRQDTEDQRYFQRVQCWDLREGHQPPGVVFLGFACDEGVRRNGGRPGASEGPSAIRRALARYPYHGIGRPLYDAGDVLCPDEDLSAAQQRLGEQVSQLRSAGHFVIVLGGGHETAWGHYQGIKDVDSLHILNWDAHFDLREGPASSGTPFLQIAEHRQAEEQDFAYHCYGVQPTANTDSLYQTAKRWRVDTLEVYDIVSAAGKIKALLSQPVKIYVSICLDVFSQAVAPGVSAPSVAGLMPWQVLPSLRLLALSGKVCALDIVELSPVHDRDNMTANLAALCIAEFLHAKTV